MWYPRVLVILVSFSSITLGRLEAELVAGSAAITTAPSPLSVNGRVIGNVDAGQSVTVLGVQAASHQAAISYQPAKGPKVVGLVPVDNLIAVDAGPATNAPASAPVAVATPAPTPELDFKVTLDAADIAKLFKNDKLSAKAKCEGQRLKFKGIIDKVDLERGSGGDDIPILVLKSASGLPRLKVRLSSTLSSDNAYFRRFNTSIPDWWYGYPSHSLDFRLAGSDEIQVRSVYRSSNTIHYSDGYTYTRSSKSNGEWFTIFKIGEPVAIEATCKGLYMDVEFDGGLLMAQQ